MRQVPGIKKVGVMATNAAVKIKLYDKCCARFGIEVIAAKRKYRIKYMILYSTLNTMGLQKKCKRCRRLC